MFPINHQEFIDFLELKVTVSRNRGAHVSLGLGLPHRVDAFRQGSRGHSQFLKSSPNHGLPTASRQGVGFHPHLVDEHGQTTPQQERIKKALCGITRSRIGKRGR